MRIAVSQQQQLPTPAKKETATKKYSNEWVDGKWYNADGTQTYKGTLFGK